MVDHPVLVASSRRPFHHLLGLTGLSNLADGVLQVGVPLLAVTMTRSPALVSLLSAAATLPWLLLAMHAGVLVDRHDRVRILGVATAARTLVLAAGVGTAVAGVLTVPVVLALLLVLGVAEVFADSAAAALVPAVVPRDQLAAANGRLLGVQQVANAFLGAPLAGVLVGVGSAAVLGLPAALLGIATLLALRGLRGVTAGAVPRRRPPTSMRTELAEGVAFLWRHRVLRPLVLTGTVLNFASAGYFAVFVLWVVGPGSAVGLDAALYGPLAAALAVGALVGAAVADRLRRWVGELRLITSVWLLGTVLLVVPVVVPHVAAIAVTFALVGGTTMVGNVVGQTMRQRLVPDGLRGRVAGVSRTLSFGSIPVGAALGGVVGEALGLPAVFLGAVGLSLVLVVWLARTVPGRAVDDEAGTRPEGSADARDATADTAAGPAADAAADPALAPAG
ncbi:MFS transporter [Cellulomonas aerilata]|uniref:MFS transporter n=1 Tax=Cellulomonas aerilata TaxID=515326 RepID=A0A512D844_9CELL|nr:MFS transporter [Cellulomonas aerilata]GEO32555.1 MFS transporter [Cellulomonas aerilata]